MMMHLNNLIKYLLLFFSAQYKGEAGDASVLGEMIFGAVAMNCKSVSLKIHIMNDPKR